MMWVRFCLLLVAVGATSLAELNLDGSGSSVSGISSGADFGVQMMGAFSRSLIGAAIFAGEPYHCAVMAFPHDPLSPCSSQPPHQQGPGCVGQNPAHCIGCPDPFETLSYDHCKNFPSLVVPALLSDRLLQLALDGLVDHPRHLGNARLFLYKGVFDSVYLNQSVALVANVFKPWMANPQLQVKYVDTIPSTHAWPTVDFGSPCGMPNPHQPPAIQACNYDGSGEALQWIYNGSLTPPPPGASRQGTEKLIAFNQTLYFDPDAFPGMASTGYLYVPRRCQEGNLCRLHIAFHGCTMYALNPQMGINFTWTGLNAWADENDLVILYPQNGGYVEFADRYSTNSFQQQTGCWDSYGQTGKYYATKQGLQMAVVRRMVKALGVEM